MESLWASVIGLLAAGYLARRAYRSATSESGCSGQCSGCSGGCGVAPAKKQ